MKEEESQEKEEAREEEEAQEEAREEEEEEEEAREEAEAREEEEKAREEEEEEAEEEEEKFEFIHKQLVDDWSLAEINHHVSKAGANELWKVADKYFHRMYKAKEREQIKRKVPQFLHTRRKLNDEHVPTVTMSVAYKHKRTGEISIVETKESMPTSQYPPNVYTKLYEVASVEVIALVIGLKSF